MSRRMRRIGAAGAIVLALLAGCSAHPKRVDCERHLKPINTPAQVAQAPEPQR